MQNLFKVDGQTLTPIEIYPAVSDTVNYLTFAFMFSYDWAGLTKSVIFTSGASIYEVPLTDDEVLESDHVNLSAGVWEIAVVGDVLVDAVVTRQITTSSYNYTVTQASATSGGVFPPSIASQVYINTNQATPQTFVDGIPKLAADRVIDLDNELADKKYVDDTVATVTRDSLGLDTDDTVTFANLSGTNTGDQDVSGAISTHNTATDAHSILARKTATMQLLISRTIGAGENVSAITWTQDDAGTALALKDVDIRIRVPSNEVPVGSSAYIYARFNDIASSGQYVQSIALANALYASIFRATFGLGILSLKENGGYLSGSVTYSNYDGTTVTHGAIGSGTVFAVSSVAKIYLFVSGQTYIPSGTVVEIWGRTA